MSLRTGPDADSANAAFVDLRFWKPGLSVEVPVEITNIARLDPPTVRTVEGTIYSTPSEAAAQLNAGGGGEMMRAAAFAVLQRLCANL